MTVSTIRAGIAAVAAAALLSACGSGDHATPGMQHGGSTGSTPAAAGQQGDHNDQDIAFAQDMIPHHSQALDMARLAPSRTTNPKVLDLAARIEKAQDPEINQMRDWLTRWGATAPAQSPGMDHGSGHGSMPGMMTADEMDQLEAATGVEFDRRWLEMMIKHHEGAVEMANTELDKGQSSEAKTLARAIIDGQQAEITEMQDLILS
ncbi:DUF305 domain-containing protein [Actinokineospora sp.]|uniref:DUF305 domain-containing protein n=1 Tax=Actinokineospora sp. TaxID=1872133 RepID=UPI004037E535